MRSVPGALLLVGLLSTLGAEEAHARAPLDGGFMFLGYEPGSPSLASEDIPRYFQELAGLQFNTVIIAASRKKMTGGCGPGSFEWLPHMPQDLPRLLDEAAKHGITVYLGLSYSLESCPEFTIPANAEAVRADTALAMEVITRVAGGHPALAGFYLPDEPGLVWPSTFGYYRQLVQTVRAYSSLPIMVSPYLALATFPPAQVAAMAAEFRAATGVDIQAWQDSVGADAIPLHWGRPYAVEEYFGALAAALGAGLWADVELFNYGPGLSYFDGAPYRPASVTRVNAQLWQTRFAARRVSWLPQFHMGSVDRHRYPEADRLLAAYKALYGLAGEYLAASYTWITPPSPVYPDRGNALLDRVPADPKQFVNPGWVGILGNAALVVDLGATRVVDWVAVHTLNDPVPGIAIPSALHVECSPDGVSYAVLGTFARPFALRPGDREYTLANTQMLRATCRTLRITLVNSGWSFLGELELVAEPVGAVPAPPPTAPIGGTAPPPPTPASPDVLPSMSLNVAGGVAPTTIQRYIQYEGGFDIAWAWSGGSGNFACRIHDDAGNSWDASAPSGVYHHWPTLAAMARGSITFSLSCSTPTEGRSLNTNISYQ